MTNDELIARIKNGTPWISRGIVSHFHDGEGAEVPIPEGCEAYLDTHPDGDARGYTPYLFEIPTGRVDEAAGVFFDLETGEWLPTRPSGD